LTAIQLLIKQNIVHNDLKENNVMFDEKREVPILIDYGLSYDITSLTSPNTLETVFYTYGYDYAYWSFETAMISFITNKVAVNWSEKISVDIIQQVIQDFIGENPIFKEIIDKNETKHFKDSLMNYMKSFHGKTYQETIDEQTREQGGGPICSEIDVLEDILTGKTYLYVEKGMLHIQTLGQAPWKVKLLLEQNSPQPASDHSY
jgi:hypothetical protein